MAARARFPLQTTGDMQRWIGSSKETKHPDGYSLKTLRDVKADWNVLKARSIDVFRTIEGKLLLPTPLADTEIILDLIIQNVARAKQSTHKRRLEPRIRKYTPNKALVYNLA